MPEIRLDTNKPTMIIEASSWEEFREKVDIEYEREVGASIDWEKSDFLLMWIAISKGPQEIIYDMSVPIQIASIPPNMIDIIRFNGYVRGYIVER